MLYQIYVISEIKLNLEMFRYNVGSQHCQNNRKYPTLSQLTTPASTCKGFYFLSLYKCFQLSYWLWFDYFTD